MADDPDPQPEPTQTLPKTGARIPLPERQDVMDALRKTSEPDKSDDPPIVDEDSA
jgi:hypothetical protein